MKLTQIILNKGGALNLRKTKNGNSYSSDEKQRASNLSIVEYLKSNYGWHFKFKNNYYTCVEHDSFVVYPDQRGWVWNSQGLKGGDVIAFVMKYENLTFAETLDKLISSSSQYDYSPPTTKPQKPKEEQKHLQLPDKETGKFSRIFAYLCYTRRIDKNVVNYCFKNNTLYQDKRGNCVFVGFDKNNKPASGFIRGTLTDQRFRGDCSGSNKKVGFQIKTGNHKEVYVFEAAIDAMSHASIANLAYKDSNAFLRTNRLALGGLNTLALDQYLLDNPEVEKINFCLDNDYNALNKDGSKAPNHGQEFAEKCCAKYQELGYTVINFCPKLKDFNEDLINIYLPRYQKQNNQQKGVIENEINIQRK